MLRLFAVLATLLVIAPAASAERRRVKRVERPQQVHVIAPVAPPKPPPSLTLPQGVVAAHLAFEMSMSSGAVLEPASIAPDISVGVFDDFTLSAVTSGSALTGFRGSAGWGMCLSGDDTTCPTRYKAGGIEGLYSLTRGSAAFALNAGILWTSLEPTVHTDLKLGVKLKMSDGNVFAVFSPNVWLALDDRFDRVVPHEHQLWLPVSVWVKPVAPLALGVGTGVKGPMKNFADRMSIPVGVLGQYSLDPFISVGASFVFGKILGGSSVMDPGIDARVVQVWINVMSG
ncbi:MAG TPA: hypothetical protein VIV40_03985 [Kofleriaceae bacterium]